MKNKKLKDKDKVFEFLKKYISLSMVSILIVISVLFFFVYRNLEISRITESSINSLLQLGLSCDTLFDSIRKLTIQVYNDADISYLVNGLDADIATTRKLYGRFSSYSLSAPNLISIYVYGKQADCFYTTLYSIPRNPAATFFDTAAVKFIYDIRNVKVLYPIPRKIKLYGAPDIPDNNINAYTFIYYGLPRITTGYFEKVVMINVSEEWVKKSLELWNKGMNGNLSIMDQEGRLVSTLYSAEMLEDISKEEFASKILKSEKDSGCFVSNVSDVKSFVTYAYSKNLGWFFIRIIPYGSMYDNLKKIGLITVLLLVLYVAVGFGLSYMITGKAKRSIDDIIDGLKKQIKDSRSDLEKLKEEFLYTSLTSNMPTAPEQIRNAFSKYNIAFTAENMLLLVLFRIDFYNDLFAKIKSYDIRILKQAVMNTSAEIFHEKYTVEAVDMKDDDFILILADTGCPEQNPDHLDNMIKLVQDSVEKDTQVSLSAALSSRGYTFSDINLLYTEVRQASSYRLFYGHKCIIHSEELKTLTSEDYVYPAEKEKMLQDLLMLGKLEPAGKLLVEILDSTRGYPVTVLNSLLLRLTSSLGRTFESIENISKYSLDYNFNSFIEALNKCETLDEIHGRFYDMFDHVFSILEQQRNSKYGLLINKAIDIINRCYADPGLCLNSIASELNISPGYLGKLFRTYTSKSVGDSINKIRIEKALKLLEECAMPIYDISAMVGFSNKNYFYTIFKRIEGITPSEYRQKAKK